MYILEKLIKDWRQEMEFTLAIPGKELDKLSDTIKENSQNLISNGLSPKQAFLQTSAEIDLSCYETAATEKDKTEDEGFVSEITNDLMSVLLFIRSLIVRFYPSLLFLFIIKFILSIVFSSFEIIDVHSYFYDSKYQSGLGLPFSYFTNFTSILILTLIILLPFPLICINKNFNKNPFKVLYEEFFIDKQYEILSTFMILTPALIYLVIIAPIFEILG